MSPILEAAPGMALDRMKSRSTVSTAWPDGRDLHGVVQPRRAHRVRLRCRPDAALDLPEGELTIVETRRGHAARLYVTPQPRYLDRQDALRLADVLAGELEATGFVRDEDESLAITAVADHLDRQDRARYCVYGAPFGSGRWRAEIWLRVAVRSGTELADVLRLPHDGCLVSLQLWDPILLEDAS